MASTPTIRDLARKLLAIETSCDPRPTKSVSPAASVCEKLRVPLAKFAGKAGYHSLISRAIAIAKANAPALGAVEVTTDGTLVGLDEIADNDSDAGVAVLFHLLDLLGTFIGEPLTLSLLRDAWPEATLEQAASRTEERA